VRKFYNFINKPKYSTLLGLLMTSYLDFDSRIDNRILKHGSIIEPILEIKVLEKPIKSNNVNLPKTSLLERMKKFTTVMFIIILTACALASSAFAAGQSSVNYKIPADVIAGGGGGGGSINYDTEHTTAQSSAIGESLSVNYHNFAGFQYALSGAEEFSRIFALVTWYYNSILNRAPEPGGAEGWTSEIQRIDALGIDVKEGFIALGKLFLNSTEYLNMGTTNNQYVVDLYETFLGRTPLQGEADYWAGELSGGLTRNILMNYFIFSAEFKTYMDGIFGNTAVRPEYNLVNDLYRGFLSRLPDNGGFNYWLAQMQTAQCGGDPQAIRDLTSQIALNFLNSQEYANRNTSNSECIEDYYNGILRRGAELAGYLSWLGELDGGTYTRAEMLQLFVDSAEFQARVQQVIDAGCSP